MTDIELYNYELEFSLYIEVRVEGNKYRLFYLDPLSNRCFLVAEKCREWWQSDDESQYQIFSAPKQADWTTIVSVGEQVEVQQVAHEFIQKVIYGRHPNL